MILEIFMFLLFVVCAISMFVFMFTGKRKYGIIWVITFLIGATVQFIVANG